MAYKALRSFVGVVSMRRNEVKDIEDQEVANNLLRDGFIEEIKDDKPKSSKSSKPAKNKGGEVNG